MVGGVTSESNIEQALDAAIGALGSLAARRERLPQERADLIAIAWRCGMRNVRALARFAGVSRDTVYADLRDRDIDPGDRDRPASPRYRPLRRDAVRQAADAVGGELSGAILAETPDPLVLAAWQAHLALQRVADLTDTSPNDRENRLAYLRELASSAELMRRYAHQALAAEFPDKRVAAAAAAEQAADYESGRPVVTGASLIVSLPDDESSGGERMATVQVGSRGLPDPLAGWTSWGSGSPGVRLPRVTAYRHLEVQAALANLAELFTDAEPADT